MRPLHYGRVNTSGQRGRAIPLEWDVAHRPWALGTVKGEASIFDPAAVGEPVWDEQTQQVQPVEPTPYWTGPFNARALGRGSGVYSAEDPETLADYLITICDEETPGSAVRAAAPVEGHRVVITMTDDAATAGLVGSAFTVVSITRNSWRFETDLFCRLAI